MIVTVTVNDAVVAVFTVDPDVADAFTRGDDDAYERVHAGVHLLVESLAHAYATARHDLN